MLDPVLELLNMPPPRFHLDQAVVCVDPTITHENAPSITMHLSMDVVYRVEVIKRRATSQIDVNQPAVVKALRATWYWVW